MTNSPNFDSLKSTLELIGIPPLYLKITQYNEPQANLYDEKTGQYVGKLTPNYIMKLTENKDSLYIYGKTGIGKTQLLVDYFEYSYIEVWWDNWYDITFYNTAELLAKLRATKNFNNSFGTFNREITNIADFILFIRHDIKCLILDDLQLNNLSSEDRENLSLIINTCYEIGRDLWITSNYTLTEIAEILGSRISSRIVEMCDIFKMEGENRRLI